MAKRKTEIEQETPQTEVKPEVVRNGSGPSFEEKLSLEVEGLRKERELQDQVQELIGGTMKQKGMEIDEKEAQIRQGLFQLTGGDYEKVDALMEPRVENGRRFMGYSFDDINLTKDKLRRKEALLEQIRGNGNGFVAKSSSESENEGHTTPF